MSRWRPPMRQSYFLAIAALFSISNPSQAAEETTNATGEDGITYAYETDAETNLIFAEDAALLHRGRHPKTKILKAGNSPTIFLVYGLPEGDPPVDPILGRVTFNCSSRGAGSDSSAGVIGWGYSSSRNGRHELGTTTNPHFLRWQGKRKLVFIVPAWRNCAVTAERFN